ncbi:MAG TPA: N-acetylmuramoyl-L-alanine amidase-like domain-containing protein [Gemmatimonadales bacterium]|nr:N-acetylmuramoyl-L-alanine amidase-like domain-containing protein [Gemmatimonadales bacterium]
MPLVHVRGMRSVSLSLLLLTAPVAAARAQADADSVQLGTWSEADWRILTDKVRWAAGLGFDTMPLGASIAGVARSFVGTPYTPGTLEQPGPERLVINLHELDCVTFIENVLALTAFVRRDGTRLLDDPLAARARYATYLRQIRYRDATVNGYPSRLHYFTDWLREGESVGRVQLVTVALGGTEVLEPIEFMSTHAAAYPALADSANLDAIRGVERRLNAAPPRVVLHKDRIAAVADSIRDGDVIAAGSTVPGLDVVHTGFAVWENGRLHLLHAPLKGTVVEISTLPLADRIQTIESQSGILVARPQPAWFQPTR